VTPPRQSHAELADELATDTEESRLELDVMQVAPAFRVQSAAFVPVRAGCEEELAVLVDALPPSLQNVLGVREAAELRKGSSDWYAGLPAHGMLLEIGHSSDRTYCGYGNLFRALLALAPRLADARFFITEQYSCWVDEYRIRDGVLEVLRGTIDEDSARDREAHLVELARSGGDAELARFVAWQLAARAGYGIPERADANPDPKRFAASRAALATAATLAPDDIDVRFQLGRAARASGDDAGAAAYFARVVGDAAEPRLPARLLTMAATALAAGRTDDAMRWLAVAPRDRLSAMLAGGIDLDAPPGDAEQILWARSARMQPLLRAYATRVRALGGVAAARELYRWAEIYRIRKAHETERAEDLARELYDAALACDPLEGEIAAHRVMFEHGTQGPACLPGFLAVLADWPAQPDALFWAASELRNQARWQEAAELGRRYVRAGTKRGSYAMNAAKGLLIDSLVRHAYERMVAGELGAETELLLDDAITIGGERGWEGTWIGKGDLYEYRRDHAAALPWYDRALDAKPSSPHALSGKASSLSNLGRLAEARAYADQALAHDADYWHASYVKACILAKAGGDRAEIVRLARRALELEPARHRQILDEPDLAPYRAELA
jgi:tetratricopeptide (TPR) repeat protein